MSAPPGAPRAFLWVQHLLGSGHLRRTAAIARALAARGADVVVASGGSPLPGLDVGAARLVQLPAARAADASFRALVDARGDPVDDAWRAARRDALLAAFDAHAPDALVVETYPFGRRLLRFELEPLLERAAARAPRPAILASVRDILEPRDDPARRAEMAALARARLDGVLVHSDPALVPFAEGFPGLAGIADLVRHTGYVADRGNGDMLDFVSEPPDRSTAAGAKSDMSPFPGTGEVIVSAGGGAVGERLLGAALAARAASRRLAGARWRLLLGPALPPAAAAALAGAAGPGVVVEPNRRDFPALLARCRVSISQAGYNTVVDVLRAGAPAVLVPHAAAGEREQGIRAGLLAARGRAEVLAEDALAPAALAAAADAADARGRGARLAVDDAGAARSAELVLAAAARLPRRAPPW